MASPVNISELIKIASEIKFIYDSFFSKDAKSELQLQRLVDDIELFKTNLEGHKAATTKHNLTYSGYDSIQRTLNDCQKFFDDYKAVLKPKLSPAKVLGIAKFPYDLDRVDRLRQQIKNHIANLDSFLLNFLAFNSKVDEGTRDVATAQSLPARLSSAVTPSHSPILSSDSPTSSYEYLPASPTTEPIQIVVKPRQTSVQSISPSHPIPASGPRRRDSDFSFLTLPRSTLPYYAALLFGPKKNGIYPSKVVDLNLKPFGRDFNGGRELVIVNKEGNTTLKHQIKPSAKKNCYPYTWHSHFTSHKPFEVTFMDSNHSLMIKGMAVVPEVPCYVFINSKHHKEFQGEVRGKDLVDFFEFRQIITAANTVATFQHLKIWRNRTIPNYSISFYSNDANVERPCDLEFPLDIFKEKRSHEYLQVVLDFSIIEESKRKFSKASSRSVIELANSPSITANSPPKIFRLTPKRLFSSITSTTPTSEISIASSSSDGGQLAEDRSTDDTLFIETLAKRMRYLKIIFSGVDEATRFSAAYGTAYNEALAPNDRIANWSFDSQARTESIESPSGPLTPFSMSPDLGPKEEE